MKITRKADAAGDLTPLDGTHFTGLAQSHPLIEALSPAAMAAAVVRFEPGVRNHWHSHAGGQLLLVMEGQGWVQSRGGKPQRIQAGDAIVTSPHEEHWHGAGVEGPMAHLSVVAGETRWLERSPDPNP